MHMEGYLNPEPLRDETKVNMDNLTLEQLTNNTSDTKDCLTFKELDTHKTTVNTLHLSFE